MFRDKSCRSVRLKVELTDFDGLPNASGIESTRIKSNEFESDSIRICNGRHNLFTQNSCDIIT
jgi:hypothetical protein